MSDPSPEVSRMHLNPEVRNEDGTRQLQRADIETVRQTDGWMDGWDGWMDVL